LPVTQIHRPARLATRAASFRYGGRHHPGIPGGFIPFYPGDFIGIRTLEGKRPLIGVLVGGSEASSKRYRDGFDNGLEKLGYLVGRDIDLVYRYADGDTARLPGFAEELSKLGCSIIVSGTVAGTIAAKKVAAGTPTVSVLLIDPVGLGLAVSQSRPGGSVTGILNTVDSLPGKQVDIALETLPGIQQIGLILNPGSVQSALYQRSADATARGLGVRLILFEVHSSNDLDGVFNELARQRVPMALLLQDALFLSQRRRIAMLALSLRIPTMFGFREHVEEGGLISYGVDLRESWHRAANYVYRILKGALPGDLPIEFPTKLELVINMKTARALDVAISPYLLARADEVIE
jgi:putative tryptophan/tyrosine transport system substrate-binding protein